MEYNPYHVMEYSQEIATLEETYQKTLTYDVTELANWLRKNENKPLLTIGAGGSFPIAELIARLHYLATGQIGKAGELIDLFNVNPRAKGFAGLLVTASGGHSDSLAACDRLRTRTDVDWAVYCGREESKGADLLRDSGTPLFAFDLLPDKHGWIAVNALLAQAVVAARAFAQAYPEHFAPLPSSFSVLLPKGATTTEEAVAGLVEQIRSVASRERLIFLYGPDTKAAALDLDSKFAESGMGWLSLSEYRNFAHGRYQKVLPEPEKFGVIGFKTPYEQDIAQATFDQFPAQIPSVLIDLPSLDGTAEQVSSLLHMLLTVGAIAEIRGLRPGWGSKNTFGDILYEFDLDKYFPIRVAGTR